MAQMSKEEMGAKIENAFHGIGVEEGFRRGFKRLDLEFKVRSFYERGSSPYPETAHKWTEADRERNKQIEDLLNDGWWLSDKIIAPPLVMLIFARGKEIEKE